MPLRSSARNYQRISSANQGDDVADVAESKAPDRSLSADDNDGEEAATATDAGGDGNPLETQSAAPSLTTHPPIYRGINVVLMDAAQSKFNITCDESWKISEFKEVNALVTKVPPSAQRLIHMGKLLHDSSTLGDYSINEADKIIHLFPKPNVVISSSNNNEDGQANDTQTGVNDGEEGGVSEGAHVPQIILDAEEASRRSQILILSSQEIFEAQHRVKIFSFLLLIISSMELLTVMTLFVGAQAEDPTGYGGGGSSGSAPPGNPTDAPPSPAGSQMRTWQNSDYFDTLISAFGFYVSLLGIKATTENTLSLAKRYFVCLVLAGVGYNLYYYYTNVQQEEKHARERNQQMDPGELHTQAFMGILLPMTVWLLCIIRAYQFQALIREAEMEAEERTQNTTGQNGEEPDSSSDNDRTGAEESAATPTTLPYGSDDNELTSP